MSAQAATRNESFAFIHARKCIAMIWRWHASFMHAWPKGYVTNLGTNSFISVYYLRPGPKQPTESRLILGNLKHAAAVQYLVRQQSMLQGLVFTIDCDLDVRSELKYELGSVVHH